MKTVDVITLLTWYKIPETQERLATLPLKTQWVIRKNIKLLEPINANFTEFRDELIKKRNNEWFVEDNGKCHKVTDNGEEMLRINDEYLDEFQKYDNELNQQIRDIIQEDNEINNLQFIDIDDLINAVNEDCKLEINDLEMLSLIGVSEEE